MSFDRNLVLEMLHDSLAEIDLFVVGLTVSDSVMPKVTVILDGPEGLGINECAKVSRRLARRIDEHYGEDAAYSLEVTTPGADLSTLLQVSIQVILSGVHIWHQRVLGLDPNAEGDAPAGDPS